MYRFLTCICCIVVKSGQFLWLLSSIPWYGCTTVCLTIHPLKDIRVVFSFLPLLIKLLWTFMYRFLCEHTFSFSGINAQKGTVGLYGKHVYFCKKLPYFSRVAVPFTYSHSYNSYSNVWLIQFLHILTSVWYYYFYLNQSHRCV